MSSLKIGKWVPWTVGVLALAGAAFTARAPGPARGYDVEAFGALPVVEGGRIKPFDSVARNSLLMLAGKQIVPCQTTATRWYGAVCTDAHRIHADEWLLDVLFRPDVAATEPIFQVDNPDVLGLLGKQQTSNRYLTFADLEPHLDELQKQGEGAREIDAKKRSPFERAIVTLFDRAILYHRLGNSVRLWGTATLDDEIANRGHPDAADHQKQLMQLAVFRPLPPLPGQGDDAWKNIGEALRDSGTGPVDSRLETFARLATAYQNQQPWAFNAAVAELRQTIGTQRPALLSHDDSEVLFNRAEPFYLGMILYVLALITVSLSWLWPAKVIRTTAFALLLSGMVVHTTGLVARTILQGRPPVTNLYSSAVFIGWVVVLLGIILERLYKRGFGTGVASAVGFSTLLIAHHLMGDGDTMEMMRAVLDSNFWLGTHVVTVTIGYSGTFLGGAIAIFYTLRRQFVRVQDISTTRALVSMTFGVLCFSVLFSFVGTVLGGIWADQSWGRFWGWDPKENGALLIVLWNAIILHARLGGFVREKGMMALAIGGNIITSLSWFGVNMLGIGLHSYGFMDKAFWALAAFIGVQAVLILMCVAPPLAQMKALVGEPATPPVANPT